MQKKDALFIDFDGTLADSLKVMRDCYSLFVKSLGGTPTVTEFNALNGPPLSEVIERICKNHGVGFKDSMQAEYNSIIDGQITTCRPNTGARALLTAANAEDISCVIVTSNEVGRVKRWLAINEFEGFFEGIIDCNTASESKPAPHPYLMALDLVETTSDASLAIEDSISGLRSAIAANIETIQFSVETSNSYKNTPKIRRLDEAIPYLMGSK